MRLLIIEDDPKISSFLRKGFREAGYAADIAEDGRTGLLMTRQEIYDVIIADLMLPELNGLEMIEKMRAEGTETPVIILSAKRSVDDRIRGLQAGGDDYMVKPFSFSELLVRVQTLLRRAQRTAPATLLQVGDLQMDLSQRSVERAGTPIELHPRELALLELFMRNPGRIMTKTAILENVYDYSFDPQTNVVDVLVCRLRNALDKPFDQKLIHTVRGVGYVLKTA
jgi:DNA-binding response OmpR family regulator